MTTQDVRNQVKDLINGKQMATEADKYEIIPMTFNEAVKAAEGFMEEIGVVGHFSLRVEYEHYSTGARELSWRFYCWPAMGDGNVIDVKTRDCAAGLSEFRARLLRFAAPCSVPDLGSVGIPAIPSEQGA